MWEGCKFVPLPREAPLLEKLSGGRMSPAKAPRPVWGVQERLPRLGRGLGRVDWNKPPREQRELRKKRYGVPAAWTS